MSKAVFPSLWRTELRDKILAWTKFGLIVPNLLLPPCSRTRTEEIHYHQSWNYYPHVEMSVLEEHKLSTWLLIITLLQIWSIDVPVCTEKSSRWVSVQLDPLHIPTHQWTHCIYYKYVTEWHTKAVTPRVCIHHWKLSGPVALHLSRSKERI